MSIRTSSTAAPACQFDRKPHLLRQSHCLSSIIQSSRICTRTTKSHLRHFLDSHDALSRDNLSSLFEYVKHKGEPGPRVNYENIAYSLTAMRNFLGESGRGKLLVSYFRAVLRDHGGYIVTTAEVLAYEIVVNMIQALFVFNNDQQLYNHICTIFPEAPHHYQELHLGRA